jgi:hypothetical protein
MTLYQKNFPVAEQFGPRRPIPTDHGPPLAVSVKRKLFEEAQLIPLSRFLFLFFFC